MSSTSKSGHAKSSAFESKNFKRNRNETPVIFKDCKLAIPELFVTDQSVNDFPIRWPLSTDRAVPFVIGHLNAVQRTVSVYDSAAFALLHIYGCFGNDTWLRNIFWRNKQSPDGCMTFGDSDWTSLNDDQRRLAIQVQSLHRMSKCNRTSDQLIQDLYPYQTRSGSSLGVNTDSEKPIDLITSSIGFLLDHLQNDPNQKFTGDFVLQLELEEAFYLAHALGMFNIRIAPTKVNELPDLDQVWREFSRLNCQPNHIDFAVTYAAYYRFRSQGYVVKSGHKYGCDFLLYTGNPVFGHSRYAVQVMQRDSEGIRPQMNFRTVTAFERSIKAVRKIPLFCIVFIPTNSIVEQQQSVEFIKKLKISVSVFDNAT